MNQSILIGALFFVISMGQAVACNFANPHSFSCQDQTFKGRIFPMFQIGPRVLDEVWVPSLFTPKPKMKNNPHFLTIHSREGRHRTCGVLNKNRTRVGALRLRVGHHDITEAKMGNLNGVNFVTNRKPFFEDRLSLAFSNRSTQDIFRCRVFDRKNVRHLTCQYFKNNVFMGYLGFLPRSSSCSR